MEQAVGLVASMLAAAVAAQADLRPAGPWSVEYADNMCVLSRSFGSTAPDGAVTLALQPLPLSTRAEMAVVFASPASPMARRGKVTVTLLPSGDRRQVPFVRRRDASLRRVVTSFDVAADFLERMRTAAAIDIAVGAEPPLRLASDPAAKAFAALTPCQDDLLKGWGYDPAVKERIGTPAVPIGGDFATFFGRDYYPRNPLDLGQEGRVTVAWTIDANGRPADCRVLGTSGVPSLDLTTCAIVLQKIRFKPALDRGGRPMASYQTMAVRWSLD